MIISVSRRTDIPAFYSDWFMNRVREGYAIVRNPIYPGKVMHADLSPGTVDAFVFLTRNPGPFLNHIEELENRGYRFCFQMTITGYPKLLEPNVISLNEAVRLFHELSNRIGPEKIIWRFDPVVLSTLTTEDYIFETFAQIASRLKGATGRVIISFADYYPKVKINFRQIEEQTGVSFFDLHNDPDRLFRIAARLADIAENEHMEIFACAEKMDLSSAGIRKGKCIDDVYLSRILGIPIRAPKARNQRADCGCVHSLDIGQYDTCLHDCAYCYATRNLKTARRNGKKHNPQSPCLTEITEKEGSRSE